MELTRTERLILETAAELYDFEIEAAKAATMTEVELNAEELQMSNGDRPQLGDLLVHRGWLNAGQLDQVLDHVYGEIQDWSDRLTAPTPVPVPRPSEEDSSTQLAELVRQLAGLLDVLVGNGSAPRVIERPQPDAGESTISVPLSTLAELDKEDEDTKDLLKLLAKPTVEEEANADLLPFERVEPVAPRDGTLQMERSDGAPPTGTLQFERPTDGANLFQKLRSEQVQLPEIEDDDLDTLGIERVLLEEDPGAPPAREWSPPEENDTAHIECPDAVTLRVEREALTKGDGNRLECADVGNADS